MDRGGFGCFDYLISRLPLGDQILGVNVKLFNCNGPVEFFFGPFQFNTWNCSRILIDSEQRMRICQIR